MGFKENLTAICQGVPGAILITLMDQDGISVDTVTAQNTDIDVNAYFVEMTSVFGQVVRSSEQLATGGVSELMIRTDKVATVLRPLSREYFLAFALDPRANTGKARYLLRVNAPKILKELG